MPLSREQELELIDVELAIKEKEAAAPVATAAQPEGQIADGQATRLAEQARGGNMMAFQTQGQRNDNSDALATGAGIAADAGLRAGGSAIGQAVGMRAGPLAPVAVPVLGAVGGMVGEAAADIRSGDPITLGKMIRAAITGAVPGGNLIKASKAVPVAVGAAVAGSEAQSLIDTGEANVADAALSGGLAAVGGKLGQKAGTPVAQTEKDVMNAMRAKVARELQPEGVVIPPSELGGGGVVDSIAGKAATGQEASLRNQFAWQKLAREEIGLPKTAAPLSVKDIEAQRATFYEPYQTVQGINTTAKKELSTLKSQFNNSQELEAALATPEGKALQIQSKADVDRLKEVRKTAQEAYDRFKNNDPKAYKEWQNARDLADSIEDSIEQAASISGDPDLLSRLQQSRKKIAQTYAIENAVNRGSGLVDPADLGRQLNERVPLSGNLLKIAQFQQAFPRDAVEAARVQAPNVGNLGAMAATSQLSRGDLAGAAGGVFSATAGRPARAFLLSDFNQRDLLNPRAREEFGVAFARLLAEQARGPSEESDRR